MNSFGFKVLKEVTENDVQDRMVWGALGTLMELDMDTFFKEWKPKFKTLLEIRKRSTELEKMS